MAWGTKAVNYFPKKSKMLENILQYAWVDIQLLWAKNSSFRMIWKIFLGLF